MKQIHIFYKGRVQGVGFRYTFQRDATGLGIRGWVRNLPDGRVEALIEGEQAEIDQLLKHIDERFEGFITQKKCEELPNQKLPVDFQVKF